MYVKPLQSSRKVNVACYLITVLAAASILFDARLGALCVALGGLLLCLSFTSNGSALLSSPPIRQLHQTLGFVHRGSRPPCVYLSDGGHVENLGVLELLRRRVKVTCFRDVNLSYENNLAFAHRYRVPLVRFY